MPSKKCICEICTCGRHRCPHRPNIMMPSSGEACKLSEYAQKYRPYEGQRKPEAFRPKEELVRELGKLDDKTTFRTDYIPHPATNRPQARMVPYEPLPGDMDMLTSYTKDYPGKYAPMSKATRQHDGVRPDNCKFEGVPTYTSDYRQWSMPPRDNGRKDHAYVPPTAGFEDKTTFRTDYIAKPYSMPRSFKPDGAVYLSTDPFDDKTNHKIAYVQHPLQPKFIKEKPMYQANKNPLENLTTFRRDYTGIFVPPPKSFRPEEAGIRDQGPFDKMTEFREKYKAWDVPPFSVRGPNPYIKPPGDIDCHTTHNTVYVEHPLAPRHLVRPTSRAKPKEVPFDDRTTHKGDYRQWESTRELRGDPSRKDYAEPTEKFEGVPTYRAHYIPHDMIPTRSYKPDLVVEGSGVPFEGNSMYKIDYTAKNRDVCPVIELPRYGYKFSEVNARGHKIYTKENGLPQVDTSNGTEAQLIAA